MALVFTMVSAANPSASNGTPVHISLSDHVQIMQVTEDIGVHHQLRRLCMRQSPEITCS